MANPGIGVKGWRNYSTFSLFAGGSQRADRQTSLLVDTYSGNLSVLATDWILAARIPCALARSYNHLDTTAGVDRPFGPGWYWQFDMNLTGNMTGSGNVTWKAADGSEYDFTYNAGSWDSPAGMHDYTLTYDGGASPPQYILSVGRLNYTFEVSLADSRARLVSILDLNTNGLNIVRTYAMGEPTEIIDQIDIVYDNAGTPTPHAIVVPTYSGTLITGLRLLDTLDTGDYIDLVYHYTFIDGADRLTQVEPQFGGVSLDMEVEYGYNAGSGLGLRMTSITDTLGAQNSYAWAVNYATNQVASVVFPIDGAPTTGTVSYDYAPGTPSGWSHGSPSVWMKVEDARGNDWYYGLNADGTVKFALDPLWADTTHESYTEYAYNGDLQVTSVGTARPNGEAGRLTTSYYYNANKKLAAVVDAYGFVSWYLYGSRAPYAGGGTGATTNDVIAVFTPKPNTKAYDDSDHTQSETAPPSLSSPVNVTALVTWNGADYEYTDGNSNPVPLARSVMDYEYTAGTGKLERLRSCSPMGYKETTAPTTPVYTLTTLSECTEQVFDSVTGDLMESYTPKQFQAGNIGYTKYTYFQIYGTVDTVEAADSVLASAGKVTDYRYNQTHTRVTKVSQPENNGTQWTETRYDRREFALNVARPDIQSWGVFPVVSVAVYDDNGNTIEQWQADPAASPADWDGNTGGGGYNKLSMLKYDRVGRLIQSRQYVDWDQTGGVEMLESAYFYDGNGNRIRSRGPAYDAGGTDHYDYSFAEYDAANRVHKAYNSVASTNASLGTVPGATPFTQYAHDLLGNAAQVYQPLYDWPNDPDPYYVTTNTYDWLSRNIQTAANYDDGVPTTRATGQHFTAAGGVYWSMDGEGFQMWPVADLDGRLYRMYRDNPSTGDYDERTYDADGRVLHAYSYQDIDDGIYRTRNAYDNMGRLVNSGREEKVLGVWSNWNANTADTEFNWNGAVLKTYDKVNTGKFTERVYDDWGQLVTLKQPEVPNPAGGGGIIYEQSYIYDVLGRRIELVDPRGYSTLYTYDVLGRTIKVEDALTFTTRTWFDARGYQWKTLTPRGAEYSSTYDARGLRIQQDVDHDAVTDTTTWQHDANGRLTQTNLPDGGETQQQYDELGRVKLSRLLLTGSTYLDTAYEYDLNDRVTKQTLPGGYDYIYTYDDLGNRLSVLDPAAETTSYSYDLNNRNLTTTLPNLMVTTNAWDWKTGGVSSVLQEITASSGDDILTQYGFDANGQVTSIVDGRGNTWVKAYDAMQRLVSLTTPNPGTGALTQTITRDGNGNITKTEDFKSVDHYYRYDRLNRMLGHGSTNTANDETYTWNCCNSLSGYTDSFGTAVLLYDDLGRVTSNTDSAGSQVQYAYDSMGRLLTLTPPQGTNYRTEYTYNARGSVETLTVYDMGTGAVTTYGYDTTTGRLLTRDFPTVASQNIRTTYAYDSAGRLEWETVTRESGGTTNLHRTQYAYSTTSYTNEVTRTEQDYSGSWVNVAQVLYRTQALGWQTYERRLEWGGLAWQHRYTTTQTYDKCGNRSAMSRTVQFGFDGTYGRNLGLGYTYDALNRPTTMTDMLEAGYLATFTTDGNGNIAEIDESVTVLGRTSNFYSYFDVDGLNRVVANRVKQRTGGIWVWTKRQHDYSATGAILQSTLKNWNDGDPEPPGIALLHSWGRRGQHVQNTDTTATSFGAPWHWAGAYQVGPLHSPNADTANQDAYNIELRGGGGTPSRRSYIDPTTTGNQRNLWGQGMPNAKDSVSAWATGGTTQAQTIFPAVESRFEFIGTVTATDLDRATDPREKARVGIFGSGYSYYGSSPRLTSETIGRDINPLGRGDGMAYVGGNVNFGKIYPALPGSTAKPGWGSSVNNKIIGPKHDWTPGPNHICNQPSYGGCCCWGDAAEPPATLFDFCGGDAEIGHACGNAHTPCDPVGCPQAICENIACVQERGGFGCTNCPGCSAGGGGGGVGGPGGGGGCPTCRVGGGGGIGWKDPTFDNWGMIRGNGGLNRPGWSKMDFVTLLAAPLVAIAVILPALIGFVAGLLAFTLLLMIWASEELKRNHRLSNVACMCCKDTYGLAVIQSQLLYCNDIALGLSLPGPTDALRELWEDFWESVSPLPVPSVPGAWIANFWSYYARKADCCDWAYDAISQLCGVSDASMICDCIPTCKALRGGLNKCVTGGLGRGLTNQWPDLN